MEELLGAEELKSTEMEKVFKLFGDGNLGRKEDGGRVTFPSDPIMDRSLQIQSHNLNDIQLSSQESFFKKKSLLR